MAESPIFDWQPEEEFGRQFLRWTKDATCDRRSALQLVHF